MRVLYRAILETEAEGVALSADKAGKRLQTISEESRQRVNQRVSHKAHIGSELDSMAEHDGSQQFKALSDSNTLRQASLAEKGMSGTNLVDIPDPDPGKVWYTLRSSVHMQMTAAERETKLAAVQLRGQSRVGQLNDPATRPIHYAWLPWGFVTACGIISTVIIASGVRGMTVQRTAEWLASSNCSGECMHQEIHRFATTLGLLYNR